MKNWLRYHLVDATAINNVMNPIMSLIETIPAGMSNETSIKSRALGTALTYLGMGSVYSRGRDYWQKAFNVTRETSEKVKTISDAAYTVLYVGIIQPPFYYVAGSRDFREIAVGTVAAAAVALFAGPLMGYLIDAHRDFTGMKESERLPDFIRDQSPETKKYIAGLLTAASVGAMAAIYSLN